MSESESKVAANAAAKKEASPAESMKTLIKSQAFSGAVSAFFSKDENRERFLQAAVNAQVRVPALARCDKKSFLMALMQLAQMGLYPDGRNAHIIPYGSTATLVVDYKGLVTLALRSEKVSKVEAFAVYAKDDFTITNGEVSHVVTDAFGDRGEVVGYYAVCQFSDGTKKYETMSKAEVDKVRSRSRAGNNGPWVTDYDEMAKKTVFKRLSKWLPVTPGLEAAVEHDNSEYSQDNVFAARDAKVTAGSILSKSPLDEGDGEDGDDETEGKE